MNFVQRHTSIMATPAHAQGLREALAREGFVVVRNAICPTEIENLRNACRRTIDLTRSGHWPHLRSLPKQFPPWPADVSNGIWGVQHLLHPDMPDRNVFLQSYFNDAVIGAVTELLNCTTEDLVMELYNLLVTPDHDFALQWHRDDVGPDVVGQKELERLQNPMLHAQWNLALYHDTSLIVVPASHKRARTQAECDADPYEPHMPGQRYVELSAGDIVFYDNNILHRGVYRADIERSTLHGSMGMRGADPARARVILQHGIGDWIPRCNFEDLPNKDMAELASTMKSNLLNIGSYGSHLGYSQDGRHWEMSHVHETCTSLLEYSGTAEQKGDFYILDLTVP